MGLLVKRDLLEIVVVGSRVAGCLEVGLCEALEGVTVEGVLKVLELYSGQLWHSMEVDC